MSATVNIVLASEVLVTGGSPVQRESSATFADAAVTSGASNADTMRLYTRLYPYTMKYLFDNGMSIKTVTVS